MISATCGQCGKSNHDKTPGGSEQRCGEGRVATLQGFCRGWASATRNGPEIAGVQWQ